MRILIFAPHQDDEILGACILMQRSQLNGDQVFVAYATNGDYHGKVVAARRYLESGTALRLLGLNENNIFYMGYGDTGMGYDHSYLYRLFHMDGKQPLPSFVSRHTYHPMGGHTLHYICKKQEAAYMRDNFLEDLGFLLDVCVPDVIVLPSYFDLHGDHCACFLFLEELLGRRVCRPMILTYLLHTDDDMLWPNRNSFAFDRPSAIQEDTWVKRLVLRATERERQTKRSCICCFQSQGPETVNGYLLSFAKSEEWFLPSLGQPIINILPWLK